MKAPSKNKLPILTRAAIRAIAILPTIFRTRLDPSPSYLPIGPRQVTGLRFWARWSLWSLWRPFDWLFFGEYYEHLTWRMTHAPRFSMSGSYPPPSYQTVCRLLEAPIVPDDRIL